MNAVSITNSQVNSTPIGNAAPASGNFSQITGPLNWSYIQSKPYPVAGQNWNYTSGGGGQPSWLWGTNDGQTMQIWNPGNFSVNYANSAGGAPWTGISGTPAVTQWQWNWSAQSGSPPYEWGTPTGGQMYLYDPGQMIVARANSLYQGSNLQPVHFFQVGRSNDPGTCSYCTVATNYTFPSGISGYPDGSWNIMCTPASSTGHPTLIAAFSNGGSAFTIVANNGQANEHSYFNFLNCMTWHN